MAIRMWGPILELAISSFLVGCTGVANLPAPDQTTSQTPADLRLASTGEPTTVGLFHQGKAVKVGDDWAKARDLFPEPPKGAYEIRDVPATLPNSFEVHGWETSQGEGYGVIGQGGRILAAMYQLERTNEDTVQSFVNEEQAGQGDVQPMVVRGAHLRYWFWLDKGQSLMVCSMDQPKAGQNLTLAMGDNAVLAALRIGPTFARRDIARLDQMAPTVIQPSPIPSSNGRVLRPMAERNGLLTR